MHKLAFVAFVAVALRIEYMIARFFTRRVQTEWNDNKVRLFSVRVVCFTHAFLSSIGCLGSLFTDSNFLNDPYHYQAVPAEFVFLFSTGYFIYDLCDMFVHGELDASKEYLVHHSLVISAFTAFLLTGKLYGLALVGLLVEVQTVFLHSRTMVLLVYGSQNMPKYVDYIINANMICLFLFRHTPICYLLFNLLFGNQPISIMFKLFLIGGLTFLEYHNIHLTMSVAESDGFFGYERKELDEDSIDPLGSVRKEREEAQNGSKLATKTD